MNEYQTPGAPGGRRYEAPQPMTAMGIAGLVLGILALLTSFLPFINNFSFVLALLGLVFAIVGIVGTVRGKRRGKALAIAALAICVVSIVVVLATQAMFSAALDEAAGNASSSSTTPPAATDAGQPVPASGSDEGKQAKYAVSIDDCQVTQDYSGAPAIVVTYTFANNSDKPQSFIVAVSAKAFQNGVQLDTGIVQDIDAQSSMNEVKPGATATVQMAYALDDQSDVSVECTELISMDDAVLAQKTFSVA
ncbi:DUF5067 domain-containing protein [Arabiibacter massiliensis]|uniref:DUF5067 domain-containing protein n=1 Tax=Arabiibacter massiliensis TaxID=1870985 RepID=UPI00155ADB66|nr:DUF5067 domain-containing protein [Arabiibacter massiliensis]